MRQSRTEHPGSTGGWSATLTDYDILGRTYRQSVPTETNSSYAAAGDDSTRGFIYNYTYYDWKGRPTRTVPSDSNGSDGKDTLITYDGCGCGGGQVTTVKGPVTTAVDVAGNTQTTKRRWQKAYEDILGRTFKTEQLDLDGASIYSTVKTTFNGRDQATLVRQYSGSDTSSTYQDTTMSYDGHGRVYQSHKPEQRDASNNLKYTTYNYNTDDSISSVTDGRGVVTNYTYNSRRLVTNIGWNVGSTGVTDPADVTFSYDNLGNRTAMTDGLGSMAYAYDSLSRMTGETRTFSDTLADKPSGNYNLTYEYTLTGQLKSYTDPWGKKIDYTQEKTGRLSAVTGTSFAGVTTYANNPGYRAWGGLKHLEYGSGRQMNLTYNDRLQAASFVVNKITDTSDKTFDRTYQYYNDGMLKVSDDNLLYKLDRLFVYDHKSRVKIAKSGIEAFGGSETNPVNLPYRQSYEYDAFGNITSRDSTLWNYGDWDFSFTFTNDRSSGGSYDSDGRMIIGDGANFTYDGAGEMVSTGIGQQYETTIAYDGNGGEGKRANRVWNTTTNGWDAWETMYQVPSSVLRQTVTEATATGKKKFTYVIAGGTVVARQGLDASNSEHVSWQHRDPSGLSTRSVEASGTFFARFTPEERDGLGNNVGVIANLTPPDRQGNSSSPGNALTFEGVDFGDCELDGIMTPCSMVRRAGRAGSLQAEARYHSSRSGFHSVRQDFDQALPGGGSLGVFFPDIIRGGFRTDGNLRVWKSAGIGGNGNWFTLQNSDDDDPQNVEPPDFENGNISQNFKRIAKLIDLVKNQVKLVGFEDQQKDTILDSLFFMLFWKKCADAFKAAKIPTPAEIIRDRGVIFANYDLVRSSSNNETLGLSEPQRSKIIRSENLFTQGVTIFEIPGPVYTFFNENSFNSNGHSTHEVMVHERIHGSGIGSRPFSIALVPFPGIGHDLSGFTSYQNILDNCMKPK